MVVDVGINIGVVAAIGGGTVGMSLFRGCLVGSVAVVSLFGDCGIVFRLDEVEDGVVGWGGGWVAGSNNVVVLLVWMSRTGGQSRFVCIQFELEFVEHLFVSC